MSEMMTTTTNSSKELTESDSSRRDSTTSSSDDASHGSSSSPPLKRPRLDDPREATIIDEVDYKNQSEEEYIKEFLSLMYSVEPVIESPCLPELDVMYADLLLSYYKHTTGKDFELSRIRSLAPFPPRQDRSEGGTHLNFFARPRGSEQEYLFYGELQHWPKDPEVVDCYIFPFGTNDGIDLILHPPHVNCPKCEALVRGRELEDDEVYYY